jgi:hypothetical protein
MKIELRKLSDIKPYLGNPRQNDAAVNAVVASIKEFGFASPSSSMPMGAGLGSFLANGQAFPTATAGIRHTVFPDFFRVGRYRKCKPINNIAVIL